MADLICLVGCAMREVAEETSGIARTVTNVNVCHTRHLSQPTSVTTDICHNRHLSPVAVASVAGSLEIAHAMLWG